MSNFQVITFDGVKQKRVVSADSVFDFSAIRVGADNLQIQQNGSGASASFDFGNRKLYNVAMPGPTDDPSMVATKGYVDAVSAGLDPKEAARLATTAALPACTYANGTAGVGATLTADANGVLTVDSVTPSVADRILVKNQAAGLQNGIYVVTAVGAVDAPFVLTRAADFDGSPAQEVNGGEYCFVKEGTVNADSGFVVSSPNTDAVIGTTAIVFTQFSQAGTLSAGNGLTKTGTVLDVVAGDASLDVQADSVAVKRDAAGAIGLDTNGIKLNLETSNPTLAITDNKVGVKYTDGLTSGANGLTLSLDGSTLALGASGIKVNAAGVTETELNASVAGNGLTGGAGTALAVGAGNGISVATDAVAVAADATGGANLAKAINVSSNGVAVKVDDSTIEGDATTGQLRVKDSGIASAQIFAGAVTAAKLNTDVFGAGLEANATTNAIDVGQGNGITVSANSVAVKPDTTGGANLAKAINVVTNGVAVKVDDSTIEGDATTGQLRVKDSGIASAQIFAGAVTAAKLNTDVFGAGLEANATTNAIDIGQGNGITVSANSIAVKPDTTGGANLAKAINVVTNGLAVKVDDSTIEGDATTGQLRVKDSGIASAQIFAGAVTAAKLNTDVFGAGLVANGSTNAIDVNVGNGIEIATDAIRVKADATGGANLAKAINVVANGLAVKVDDSTIEGDATTGQLRVKDSGIASAQIFAGAVTAAKLNSDVFGAGLVANGSTNAVDVGAGDAISVAANAVAVDFTKSLQADEAIAALDVCYVKPNGHVAKAQANIDISAAELVIAQASISNAASGACFIRRGGVVGGFTGLTPGIKYYVSRSTAGALVSVLTGFVAGEHVYSVGRAMSATEIVYNPQYEFEF